MHGGDACCTDDQYTRSPDYSGSINSGPAWPWAKYLSTARLFRAPQR